MIKIEIPKGKYVLAVSGGVDSVVLLDVLSKISDLEIIVAHFDHGIRHDSSDDADFVQDLAKKYNLPYESKREELGESASEDLARNRRYEFLREVAKKHDAKLVTAHHADDVIETIAINLVRGTGWRGLAAMDSDIVRPLTQTTKTEIVNYAKENNLTWHEDFTNQNDDYLRNKIRRQTMPLDLDTKRQLLALWEEQKEIKNKIDREIKSLAEINSGDRYFFINVSQNEAIECLRYLTEGKLTRPQLINCLYAIKTYANGKIYEAGNGVKFSFTYRNFTVELLK